MTTFQFTSNNEDMTRAFGKALARHLKKGDIICLFGDLGTGKTVFVKGIAEGLKVPLKKVHSPTFVLMNIYEGRKGSSKKVMPVYHFDLYRLENTGDISLIGYEEFFYGDGVAVIEWADRLQQLMPKEYLRVELKHRNESTRKIICKAYGPRYNGLLKKISSFNK